MITLQSFAQHLNFLTPRLTNDGKPYGPIKFKQLVQDCYLISKNINTPYSDVLNMTPTERNYILNFLVEEAHKMQKELEESRRKSEQLRKGR